MTVSAPYLIHELRKSDLKAAVFPSSTILQPANGGCNPIFKLSLTQSFQSMLSCPMKALRGHLKLI